MKRSRFVAFSFVMLAAPVMGTCSLFGLDQFTIPGCRTNADCEPLNAHDSIGMDQCSRFQCDHRLNANVCRRTPRDNDEDGDPDTACGGSDCDDNDKDSYLAGNQGDAGTAGPHPEVCDGKDNNCNGVVDDDPSDRRIDSQVSVPLASNRVERVGVSQVSAGSALATYGASSTIPTDYQAYVTPIAGRAATYSAAPHPIRFAAVTSTEDDSAANVARGCPRRDNSMPPCDMREAAIDGFATQFVAGVTANIGCQSGALYVGYRRAADPADLAIIRNFGDLSNVYYGIDTNPTNTCDRCSGSSAGVAGAARPAIAAMQTGNNEIPQALVTYLATPEVSTSSSGQETVYDDCTSAPADVRALGLFLMDVAGNPGRHWVLGTDTGNATRLGSSGGGGASVAAFINRGYFVGYANTTGGVNLHFIPRLDSPVLTAPSSPDVMPTDASADVATDVPMDAGADVVADAAPSDAPACNPLMLAPGNQYTVTVPSLPMPSAGTISASGARRVSIAVLSPNPSTVSIGVTWVQGCGTAASSVWFSNVSWNGNTQVFTPTTPIQISPDGVAADEPSIAAATQGFVRAGFVRNGISAPADQLGGFYVAYIDKAQAHHRVRARRIAQFDGLLIAEAPIDLTDPSVAGQIIGLRVYSLGNSPEPLNFAYGSVAGSTAGLVGGNIVCSP